MSKFFIEIITPERSFFKGEVEAAVCPTENGDIEILKNHQNMVAILKQDEIKLKIDGEWKTAVISEGFFEVRPDKVMVFSSFCDWIEDYEKNKALRETALESERESHAENLSIHREHNLSLARAIAVSHRQKKNINF